MNSVTSEFFRDARDCTIVGGKFSHVERDQYNYHGPTTIIQKRNKERTEFDEFEYVKRGAICRLRDVWSYMYPRRWDNGDRKSGEEGQYRADRTLCAARVRRERDKMFTVMQYSGPEARKAFEADFWTFSRTLTSNTWQVYGYNDTEIPSIISYNELIPVAHLHENMGPLGQMYLHSLRWQLGCESNCELWMDTARGMICRGPPGPDAHFYVEYFDAVDTDNLPVTTELLQEDVLLRFLASFKSDEIDRIILDTAASPGPRARHMEVFQPIVISTSTNAPIAIANNTVWRSDPRKSVLSDQKVLENGLVRFTLGSGSDLWLTWNFNAGKMWMSQAWSIFHAPGISLEDNLSGYKLVVPHASLDGILSPSEAQRKRQAQHLIYLFVRPPPKDLPYNGKTSSVHFWSFDEDGHSPLSYSICDDLGLPIELRCYLRSNSYSWSSCDYELIYQYQHLRGFNPTTTDFARHFGYVTIYQPVTDSDQFEQFQKDPLPEDGTLLSPGMKESVTHASGSSSFWSTILLPLSPTVSKDSDILTVGF
ncbi:hypothetical protein PM082_010159 [Marasmius tenuissimus]|nr:hypothetical protein PM082_010159 [Marasmius tenuissimus]